MSTSPTFRVERERTLFSGPYATFAYYHFYAVAPGDRHFLMLELPPAALGQGARLVEIDHWAAGLPSEPWGRAMTDHARLTAALADRYRIERELGAGGMATVYLAEDLKHDRKAFPDGGGAPRITSQAGGEQSVWSHSGRELFYALNEGPSTPPGAQAPGP